MRLALFAIILGFGLIAQAANYKPGDYLVKLKTNTNATQALSLLSSQGAQVQKLSSGNWVRIQVPQDKAHVLTLSQLNSVSAVEYAQPNYLLTISASWKQRLAEIGSQLAANPMSIEDLFKPVPPDNPAIPAASQASGSGTDPEATKQWGMKDAGVEAAWSVTAGKSDVVVAVLDTGVDYTHEDLVHNMWRNPGETGLDANGKDKSSNGIDDDGNGYIDDIVGWDFASKDNKPYDFTTSLLDMLMGGGNPGHGTHCAGNVAARAKNGKGIFGVAPNVKIMALRFITEKGQGTTADAIEAINYSVKMGAKISSNSWGSEGGGDPNDPENLALIEAIKKSEDAGVLFIAAAGNGRVQGQEAKGYDNDTDSKPAVPASYDMDIIVSVAALDVNGNLGKFSNWGRNTVDIGAPGVNVHSTVPGGYQSVILKKGFLTQEDITWDGTSMATPHVAGAAALYWSKHPNKTWQEVKSALLASVRPTSSVNGKTTSGGRLDVENLMTKF